MEENSLSEEIASSRLARAADADPGKRKRNKKSKRKNKASKKNKSNKKSKKAEKKKNKAEKKKNKKAEKKKNKKAKRKNKSNMARQSSTVPDTCVSSAVNTLYNGLSKKASNFDRQLKRIEARLPKIESKRGKMTEYNQTMEDLVAANSSCPAGNQTEIDALIATLGACESQISTACATPMINQTQIDECKTIVEGFVAEVETCFGLNSDPAAACACWEGDAMAELEMGLKGCVIKESEANVTAGFKACKGAVSSCNKATSSAIPVLVACSKTEADLVAEAEQVANNIEALNQAKTAVEAAASRSIRAVATNCTEYIALVDMLVELSVESPEITDVAEDIVTSSVTCTDAEKATLATSVTALDEVIAEAEAALNVIQDILEDATGSTAAIETTPLVSVTTAASRMRMRGFMKQLKFKM